MTSAHALRPEKHKGRLRRTEQTPARSRMARSSRPAWKDPVRAMSSPISRASPGSQTVPIGGATGEGHGRDFGGRRRCSGALASRRRLETRNESPEADEQGQKQVWAQEDHGARLSAEPGKWKGPGLVRMNPAQRRGDAEVSARRATNLHANLVHLWNPEICGWTDSRFQAQSSDWSRKKDCGFGVSGGGRTGCHPAGG